MRGSQNVSGGNRQVLDELRGATRPVDFAWVGRYLPPELFHDSFSRDLTNGKGVTRHHEWLGRHARLINESKEEFVRHNKTKYGLPLIIRVACEVWDFGTMSRFYAGMREAEQDAIAAKDGVHNGRMFATRLRSLNYRRNVCAHHSRLWNRNIVDQPKLPSMGEVSYSERFTGSFFLVHPAWAHKKKPAVTRA